MPGLLDPVMYHQDRTCSSPLTARGTSSLRLPRSAPAPGVGDASFGACGRPLGSGVGRVGHRSIVGKGRVPFLGAPQPQTGQGSNRTACRGGRPGVLLGPEAAAGRPSHRPIPRYRSRTGIAAVAAVRRPRPSRRTRRRDRRAWIVSRRAGWRAARRSRRAVPSGRRWIVLEAIVGRCNADLATLRPLTRSSRRGQGRAATRGRQRRRQQDRNVTCAFCKQARTLRLCGPGDCDCQ
jgi:hypothetical protein